MPSQYKTKPEANAWMAAEGVSCDREKPLVTAQPGRGVTASRISPPERRDMSAQVQRLARRLAADPDELAKKISPDTLRRTKYPVLETVNPDGTRSFKHDSGISEGLISSVR